MEEGKKDENKWRTQESGSINYLYSFKLYSATLSVSEL
jgi:hypothetical protein